MYYGISRAVQKNWGWILALGFLQVVLGFIALTFVGLTTLVSVVYLGALFLVSGGAELVVGFQKRKDGHLGAHLFFGVLYIVGGALIMWNPVGNALFLTIMLAMMLLISGIVSVIGSIMERGPQWAWFAFLGAVSVFLGFSILQTPLESSIWLIGTFVGVDMLFKGFTLLNLAWAARKPNRSTRAATA